MSLYCFFCYYWFPAYSDCFYFIRSLALTLSGAIAINKSDNGKKKGHFAIFLVMMIMFFVSVFETITHVTLLSSDISSDTHRFFFEVGASIIGAVVGYLISLMEP